MYREAPPVVAPRTGQARGGLAPMTTATVTATQTDIAWLAERQLVVGARVGSCIVARQAGTVIAVRSLDDMTVRWDDGRTESVRWTAISPFGYVVEVAPVA